MEFEKLQSIIAQVLKVEPEKIKENTSFVEELGADSLELFQILMGIEAEFDVILDEKEFKKVKKVEDVLAIFHNSSDDRLNC